MHQSIETPDAGGQDGGSGSEDEDDIEAQIRKEVEGLKPSSAKPRQFQAIRLDIPCGSWMLLTLAKDNTTRTKPLLSIVHTIR